MSENAKDIKIEAKEYVGLDDKIKKAGEKVLGKKMEDPDKRETSAEYKADSD
jgi:hypothetical protein